MLEYFDTAPTCGRLAAVSLACVVLLVSGCGGDDDSPPPDQPTTLTATINNFIVDDPLAGDNGLPQSPAKTVSYGQISIGIDVDGNAIQAVDEVDMQYFEGKYYLYGPSFTCGAFNYAPGVNTGPLIPTNPNSTYRYCGLTVYESDDMMNWRLIGPQYIQDPLTGEHFYVKKPRVKRCGQGTGLPVLACQ